jgi:very-short-patch-repair endonuclease
MPDPRARELRQNPTDAERKLWAHLRLRQVHGHKFRRQRPIGPYIVDFVCLEERLVIEVDGSQHLERALLDARRDDYLESLGFRVLRFWDNQVLNETDAIIEVIAQVLEKREEGPPSLSQAEGRL